MTDRQVEAGIIILRKFYAKAWVDGRNDENLTPDYAEIVKQILEAMREVGREVVSVEEIEKVIETHLGDFREDLLYLNLKHECAKAVHAAMREKGTKCTH